MKLSYNWLKEFVDIKANPKQLANDLNSFGHEVEEVNKVGGDYIFDLSITANHGDCLSVLGMAREVAALYNLQVKSQKSKVQVKSQKLDKNIKVKISDPKICPRFTARIIDNIEVKESPKWIQDILKTIGFRPINNIVDITNLIMIETGQPLHAFDYDKIHAGEMNIELAKNGESLITLDGKERKLDNKTIVISDNNNIYDLAGIMGGFNSEINNKTKTIILQGSIFDKKLIRKTSKKLHHTTDASYRFERGVDINGTSNAVNKASQYIIETCVNAKIGELIDIFKSNHKPITVNIEIDKINKLLGSKFTKSEVNQYLKRLEFEIINNLAIIPSYREYDISIWQDLAEEVARIYGYNNLGKNLPDKSKPQLNEEYNKKEYIKDILVNNDFTEIYSYSFADEKLMQMLGYKLENSRVVTNSVAPELKHLRMNLVPSILTAISKNPWAPEIMIFEIGKVFDKSGEKYQLIIAECSKRGQNIKTILDKLNIKSELQTPDQKILDYLKIRKPVKYIVIDLDKIDIKAEKFQESFNDIKYTEISEFPPTIRDLAFIVDNNINTEKVRSEILSNNSHIFLVELFDEFQSDKFGNNKKNIAYHIWMQDMKKPMDPKYVDTTINNIITKIEKQYKAKIRS